MTKRRQQFNLRPEFHILECVELSHFSSCTIFTLPPPECIYPDPLHNECCNYRRIRHYSFLSPAPRFAYSNISSQDRDSFVTVPLLIIYIIALFFFLFLRSARVAPLDILAIPPRLRRPRWFCTSS